MNGHEDTATQSPQPSVLVVMPTYNERDNLVDIVGRLRSAVPAADLLIVDDNSPDGTGQMADVLARDDGQVHVLHRSSKAGLGAAYVAGFRWGIAQAYAVLVEMDADGSHAPEELPRLIAALDAADLALGSRYVKGGRLENWSSSRERLSRWGNRYARHALRVPALDLTGGYRAFRRETLQQLSLADIASQGYCFQIELAWRATQAGLIVTEVPITFRERRRGTSKMNHAIVREALWRITAWGLHSRLQRQRSVPSSPTGVPRPFSDHDDSSFARR